jgi:peptidoglycan hydrolase-like protein with peptidoglycan-binding domain
VHSAVSAKRATDDETEPEPGSRLPRWLTQRFAGWSRRDAVGAVVAVIAVLAILINVLFMQAGPHPAPMFKSAAVPQAVGSLAPPAATTPAPKAAAVALPRPRPGEAAPKGDLLARPRPTTEVIADIQRELARKAYYDGPVDGRYGPKTDAAIRDFETAAGLKPATEPSESLLRMIKAAAPKAGAKASGTTGARSATPPRNDPIGEVLAPSARVLALQRALAEFGYAQIKPTGVLDPETKAAIERFERERKLPITGQASDRVVRELASLTGRPLE